MATARKQAAASLPGSSWEMVTPEIAAAWLATSPGNRNIASATVAAYARDMAAGRWELLGNPIIFDEFGELMEGHHRLHAVKLSGCAVWFMVVRGAPRAAHYALDTGRTRSFSDELQFRKVPQANKVGSVVRALWAYERAGFAPGAGTNILPTRSELWACYERHDVTRAVSVMWKVRAGTGYRKCALVGSLFYVLDLISPERADAMFSVLAGASPKKAPPMAMMLRNRLIEDAQSRVGMPLFAVRGMFVKTWNLDATGDRLKQLRVKGGEEIPSPLDDDFRPVDVQSLLASTRTRK